MNTIVDTYLATWNETEPQARQALLAQHWAAGATYIDPLAAVAGAEQLDGAIAGVQAQFPGFVFSRVGTPDAHHDVTRFQWGLGPADAEPVVVGFDVLVADEQGRIATVLGFLDKVPG